MKPPALAVCSVYSEDNETRTVGGGPPIPWRVLTIAWDGTRERVGDETQDARNLARLRALALSGLRDFAQGFGFEENSLAGDRGTRGISAHEVIAVAYFAGRGEVLGSETVVRHPLFSLDHATLAPIGGLGPAFLRQSVNSTVVFEIDSRGEAVIADTEWMEGAVDYLRGIVSGKPAHRATPVQRAHFGMVAAFMAGYGERA